MAVGRGLIEQGRGLAANPTAAADAVQQATRKGADFAGELAKSSSWGATPRRASRAPRAAQWSHGPIPSPWTR